MLRGNGFFRHFTKDHGGKPREQYPVRNVFEIRRYFSKIASNSDNTAVNLLKTADAPLS